MAKASRSYFPYEVTLRLSEGIARKLSLLEGVDFSERE